eukprot:scaffold3841_cov412-Prasinococcus_capsulatus_cf.AAC.9
MVRRVRREGEVEATAGSEPLDAYQADLDSLVLSNEAVWDRERARPEIRAPWVWLGTGAGGLWMIAETRATLALRAQERVPSSSDYGVIRCVARVRCAVVVVWGMMCGKAAHPPRVDRGVLCSPLRLSECAGGDSQWVDRFLAQHSAIVYYLILDFLWLLSPSIAYNFSELIEAHAVDTYAEFVDANEELLKRLPAPEVARKYYCGDDMYMFDEFQTSRRPGERRPVVETLYDVFSNIRDDEGEIFAAAHAMPCDCTVGAISMQGLKSLWRGVSPGEHVKTMNACQDEDQVVQSPNAADAATVGLIALSAALRYLDGMESIEADTIASTITDLAAAIVDFVPF